MALSRRDENGFTPTQARLWDLLKDGEWHSNAEMYRIIDDEDRMVLAQMICSMRKILATKGLLITSSTSPTAGIGRQVSRKLMPMEIG